MESEAAQRFFSEKFVTNESCSQITKVNWDIEDNSDLIIPMKTSIITRKDIEKVAYKAENEEEDYVWGQDNDEEPED